MSRTPFPGTEEAFAEVRREEGRRKVMLCNNDHTSKPTPEGSALVSKHHLSNGRANHDSRPNRKGERMWCDHCNRHGHTREICWQIHGKPTNWVPRRQSNSDKTDGKAYQSSGDKVGTAPIEVSPQFSKEQVEHLCRLLNQSSANLGSCSVAQSGKFHFALNSSVSQEPWIIDSGASDHMTGRHNLFYSYTPCNNKVIKIADGSLSSVAGIGNIRLSQNLILKSVLHVH